MSNYNLGNSSAGCTVAGLIATLLVVGIVLFGYPQWRVYSQRLSGEAALAEAQS